MASSHYGSHYEEIFCVVRAWLRIHIPMPRNSVDHIYSSHMFEHIPYKHLVWFINECYHVRKVGVEFSVCVLHAKLYIKAHIDGVTVTTADTSYTLDFINTGSLINQFNYITNMDQQHHYMFDSEYLVNTIKQAPFINVRLREFDETLDLNERNHESIYARATK